MTIFLKLKTIRGFLILKNELADSVSCPEFYQSVKGKYPRRVRGKE